MNHPAAPRNSDRESFAGILKELTQRSILEAPFEDSSADFAVSSPKAASASGPDTRSNTRSGTRPLMPLNGPEAGRGNMRPDSVPLSYEKALRLHSRRTAVPDSASVPRTDPKKAASPARAFGNTGQAIVAQPIRHMEKMPKPSLKTGRQLSSGSAAERKKSKAKLLLPSSSQPPNATHRNELQLKRTDVGLTDLAAQRRAIVSVRLTEIELAQLKERASESGISVSAYIRSCMLDTEQLRSQVKQALAEMRALSGIPPVAALRPARTVSEIAGFAKGKDWLRLILRPAAFLLSPFFVFHRDA